MFIYRSCFSCLFAFSHIAPSIKQFKYSCLVVWYILSRFERSGPKTPARNPHDESRNLPSWKVVLSKMAVRNVRTLMNVSRLMLQNTACRASAVSAVHNRHVSSLNRCPNFTNLLCQVRIQIVAPANVILKVAFFFWLSFY